jgi:hypothetical protein
MLDLAKALLGLLALPVFSILLMRFGYSAVTYARRLESTDKAERERASGSWWSSWELSLVAQVGSHFPDPEWYRVLGAGLIIFGAFVLFFFTIMVTSAVHTAW